VRGHLARVARHDVLIQWGNVNIDISSPRVTGNTTIPLVSKAELLKVANSLTVPTSDAIGPGFPLASSMPASVQV
jgi:hypothetical protein